MTKKSIILLGANGLIGKSVVKALHRLDFDVITVDQFEADVCVDLKNTSIDQVFSGINLMKDVAIINCAGFNPKWEDYTGSPSPFDPQSWDDHYSLNLKVPFQILRWVYDNHRSFDFCDVILFGSMYSVVAPNPELYRGSEGPNYKDLGYVSMKHALAGLVKAFNALNTSSTRVSLFSPGAVRSPSMSDEQIAHFEKVWDASVNDANEIADFVAFYLFRNKSLFSGQLVNLTGNSIK